MKVQLHGQSVRLRIDESELAQMFEGGRVENLTQVAGACMRQLVRVGGERPVLLVLADGWCLEIPAGQLVEYAARLPCRDGLAFSFASTQYDATRFVLEVDVRDSAKVRGRRRTSGQAGPVDGT